eukprot:TRINITY_DN82_c0_g1_i2.p1 TRINITY_DN82_c0_g1~~TRINITY_DN82_c0_g1_i2.p1  ORF type:complete len:277 (-),score=63.17 TRINITY_DN82_c0_g1_i2:104-934(-)
MGSITSRYAFFPPKTFFENLEMDNNDERKFYWVETKENIIPVFYYQNEGSEFSVLYSHGNAEDIFHTQDLIKTLSAEFNVNIVVYDYSGYSASHPKTHREDFKNYIIEGQKIKPNEKLAEDDIKSVYKFMLEKLNIKSEKIILWGRSLGTGPSCYLASRLCNKKQACAGLILQSPFLSAIRVVAKLPFTLPVDIFPNIGYISKINLPILIIHGKNDTVINWRHGKELSERVNKDKLETLFIDGAGHNDIESVYFESFKDTIKEYFYKHITHVEENN